MPHQVQFYEAIVIDSAPDPSRPGHIKVRIPELYQDLDVPVLIAPLFPGWHAGGWQSVPSIENPDDDGDPVRVIVVHLGSRTFRWIGTSQPWSFVTDYPGDRAGARSGDGRHYVAIGNDLGFQTAVQKTDASTMSFISVTPSGEVEARTADGSAFGMNADQVYMVNSHGDILMLDGNNGIALMHKNGIAMLALEDGDVAKLNGTNVQISGGTIELGGGVVSPMHPYMLSLTFLSKLSSVLAEVIAIGAGIPAGMPIPTPNSASMVAEIATSLSSGPPYLSTRIKGD